MIIDHFGVLGTDKVPVNWQRLLGGVVIFIAHLKRVLPVSVSVKATTTRFELKQLFHLMLPILITQFAAAGFGLIDTIMAGHMSAEDLAAIAVGVGLWIPVMLLFSGIMIATTPLVAEANGARTPEKIPSISTQPLSKFEKMDSVLIKRILKLGLPIGLAIFFEVSIFSTGAIVLSPLGEITVAAHQIALSVTSQLFMIPMSLALALTIRTGTYFGEKNWFAMRKVQKVGLMTSTLFACTTMLLLLLLRPEIVSVYTRDYDVSQAAIYLILFAIGYQLMDAWQVSAAGCLRGMQDTKGPMWITMLAYWIIAFPIGIYLARYTDMGAAGVWTGLIIGLTVACVLLLMRLYNNNKRLAQN
ncbi:hypothetical protein FQR65_LT18857 [Abscondita terminalis]|nr:hypothetical protein FQR65_LT18857 [Abscondita terminalis]